MKSFKALSFKEKMEYIGILAIYPLILLFEQLGKSVKFLNSRSKQITASILTVCLMLTMIPVMSLTASATTADWSYPTSTPTEPFADGTGAENDPYIIATAQQLANMSYLVNNDNANYGEKHYKLSANIDLAGGDWTPIGDYYNPFMGTFDGAYYTISNLTVQSDFGYCGLFGYVSGMINNVALTNANVNGSYYVGGISGYLEGAMINNCSVSGSISGNTAGGISGYLVGDIYNSFSTATVTATAVSYSANAGGITGYLYAGYIMNSYNAGAVSSSVSGEYDYAYSCAGGIVGFARNDSYVQVINCYNIGTVTAENTAIGSDVKCLAGALAGDSPGSIFNSYWLTTSAATITGDNGGKYYCDSFENSTDTVSYNGATDEVSLTDALNAYVTGYSQSAENYGETAGLRIWTADTENTNNGYPVFEALHTHDNITFTPWFSTDILPTTSGNYYLVNDVTLEDYVWLQENVDITLCLNDKVVTAKEYETCSIFVLQGASLTIYDCGNTDRSYTENEFDYYWELDEVFDNNETEKLTTGGVITGMANSAIMNSGTLTINGGNIVGNRYNSYSGGGIQNNGTLTINGGHILGNYTSNFYGGGISNSGTFTMTGGEIAYNVSGGAGAGIHNWEGTVAIFGGIIHNNNIDDNISNDAGELVDLLADGYAFYDKDGNEIAPENLATAEYLEVKEAIPPHTHTGVEGEFTEWTAKSGTVSTSGNYYLADNITATGNITIASGTEVTLCLNGYTLDLGSKKITVSSGATLSICDCSEGESGVIKSTHRAALNSSDRYSDTAGAINVFGNVTISSGTVQNDCQYGRAIYVGKNANLTVSGGKVAITNNGHYAVFVGNNTLFGTDPAGTFTMTGGVIDTGTGYSSGTGVYIHNGAVATVTGGKILASSGSRCIDNIDSTLIIGGDAVINSTDEYSAIWVNANGSSATAVLHISGGTITAPNSEAAVGIANGNGDTVVYLSGNPTITGKDSDISISVEMDGTIKPKFYAVSEDGNTAYSGEALRLYLNGAHRVQSGEVVVRNSTDTEKFTLTNGGYKLEQSGENLAIATYGYNLWVGGVYVTEDNASDILGNGTASYNAETQTLYLENAVISGSYTPEDLDYAAGIYSSHALNIVISGTVDILVQSSNYGIGILVDGELNIAKDPDNSSVTLNVIGDFAAAGCLSGGNITYDGLTVKGSAEIDAQNAPTEEVALSDGIFFAGSDIAKMLQFTYTAPHTHAGIDGNFTGLADADLESGTLYTNNYFLGCDLTVSINGEIVIPSDQEVIICLNGHDIDLGESQITNKGKLIICDCTDKSGTITSENTSVAIKNSGSLTVSDVTVSSSSERTVDNDGSLTVTGGAVISGGDSAVYNAKSKTAIISGNSTITSASGYAIQNKGKLYLSSKLTVSGADSMADIYISDTASEIYATDVAGGVAFSGNVLTMKTLSTVTSGVVVYGINNNNAEKFTLVEDSPYVLIRGIGTNKNNLIIDITAPTGKISIGTNHWEDFLDKDVFGLFFKEYKYIEITGSDAESGIKSREYYLSETPVSFEAVKKSEIQWITYSGKVKIEPNNKYFIYAKITDNAGNVAYIDTDGIALDNVAPAFSVTVGADTFDDNIGRYYFITGEKEQSYTVEDGLAGVEKVEYLDSAEELDDAELGKATGWQKLNNGDKLPYVNGTVYNRYYRAIDKAGNASYVYLGVVVCYTDYKGEAFTADYTYGSREDVLVEMELDGMQLWVYRYIALLDKLSFTDGTNTYNDNYSFYDLTSKQGFGLKLPDGKIPESILENDNTVTSITLSVKPIVTAGTDFYGDIPSALPIKIIIKPTDGKVESISDISKTYDGTAVNAPTYDKLGNGTVTVEYKVKGAEDASYTTTAPINAGEYTVRVSVEASQPYKSAFATKDFKIEKATPIIGEVSVSGPDSIYFNTELNSIILDRTDKSIAGELKLAAGQTLTVGTQNYNWCFEPNDSRNYRPVNGSVSVTVVKLDPTVIWPDDLVGNAGEKLSTVTLIGDNFAWDNGDEVIVYGNDTTYKMIYTPDDIINYNVIYKQVAVDGLDVTLPTGEITLKDNKWNEFLNNITLGLFFKETQSIAITADDTESGVKEIAYYLATEELAKEAVKEIENSEWTVYADAFNIEPDNKYVVYVRITDNAGNITYINSDGIVLDSIKPIISGVEDGKDVYGDATFTVDELYLDTVTLDGEPIEVVNGKYTVPADNKEHTIVVTDKTGNQVTYKLTVYKNYKVSFVIDGKEIEVSEVGYGKNATLPEIPKKNGYTAKWDASGKNITADTVITAVYKKISQPQSPQTGDNTNIWLWVAVMFVSGFSLFGAIITKKRKEKEAE